MASLMLGTILAAPVAAGREEAPALTLEHLIEHALQENPLLGVARSALEAAQSQLGQSRAAYYPRLSFDLQLEQVTLNANSPRETLPFLDFSAVGLGEIPVMQPDEDLSGFQRGTTALSAEYLLFDFGRRANTVKSREENVNAAEAQLGKTANETILGVVSAYFNVLRSEELLTVERDARARQEEALRLTRILHSAGRNTAGDVARAEADLARAELSVVQAQSELELAHLALRRAIGLSPEGERLRLAPASRLHEPVQAQEGVEGLVRAALGQRPEVHAQQGVIASSAATMEKERAEFYPTLDLFANYNVQKYEDISSVPNYAAGLRVSWSLFDGALRRNRVGEARARLLQEQDRLRDLFLSVATDVRDAYQRYLEARERVQVTEKIIRSSELDLRLASKGYKEGIRTIYDLSTAESGFRNAKAQGVVADYDLQNAIARLYWALGAIDELAHH